MINDKWINLPVVLFSHYVPAPEDVEGITGKVEKAGGLILCSTQRLEDVWLRFIDPA